MEVNLVHTRTEAEAEARVFAARHGHTLGSFTDYTCMKDDPRYPTWMGSCACCGNPVAINGVVDRAGGAQECWWFVMLPKPCVPSKRRLVSAEG